MEKLTRNQYSIIDIAKFICALLVVGIHAQPLGDRLVGGGYLFTTLCRIAVPFFFVTSSFLFYDRNASVKKYVLRLIKLDIAWTVLELSFIIYKFYYIGSGSDVEKTFHLVQGLLWGESYMGSWFIHASWMGMLFFNWLSSHYKERIVFIVSLLFFVMALLDTSYSFLGADTWVEGLLHKMDSFILPSESFMIAVPYFYIGRKLSLNKKPLRIKKTIWMFLAALVLLFAEAIVVRTNCNIELSKNPRFEQFILLLPLTYFFVYALKQMRCGIHNNVSILFRQQSTLIFLLHQPLIIFTYKVVGQSMGWTLYVLVVIESVLVASLIILCSKKVRIMKYLF